MIQASHLTLSPEGGEIAAVTLAAAHQRALRSPFGNLRNGGYAPSGASKGFALALWKPSQRGICAFGRIKGLCARPLETFATVSMRLRAHQRALRSPFENLRGHPSMRNVVTEPYEANFVRRRPEGCMGERKAPATLAGVKPPRPQAWIEGKVGEGIAIPSPEGRGLRPAASGKPLPHSLV
jgi:hypothetical protein